MERLLWSVHMHEMPARVEIVCHLMAYLDDNQKGGNSMDLQEILDLIDEVEDLEEECEIPPGTWANEMRARAVAHFGNLEQPIS